VRLLPPESSAVEVVSREVGVSVATLERWRADALSNDASDRRGGGGQRWTATARLEAVAGIARSAPHLSIREVAAELERLRERTPRGGLRWSVSSVAHLLQRARKAGLLEHSLESSRANE